MGGLAPTWYDRRVRKKPDPYLTSPPVAPRSVASEPRPHVPGAILRRTSTEAREPSPATAVPVPVRWPPVDEYLDEPDEVHHWERIGGERREALAANPDHGDPHFEIDGLVKAHLAGGYVGSVDLKTRVSERQEYASDTCVRRAGIDPATGHRYLEELVFEVVHKRSAKETKARAEGFAKRGVRRQLGVFVKGKTIREWLPEENDWGEPLDLQGSLHDPCLAVDLPLAALFDPALAESAIARALEAKDNPVILDIKDKSEKRGRAESILTVLRARGLVPTPQVREQLLAVTDTETLERLLHRAAAASAIDEVLDEL